MCHPQQTARLRRAELARGRIALAEGRVEQARRELDAAEGRLRETLAEAGLDRDDEAGGRPRDTDGDEPSAAAD